MFDDNALQQQPSQRDLAAPGAVVVPGYPVEPEEGEGLPLMEYWRIFRRRQFTILSILILTVTTVMIGTLRQPQIYEAKLIMQIDREAQNVLSFKDIGQVDLNDEAYLETAYQNLRSRTVARRTAENLRPAELRQLLGEVRPGSDRSRSGSV